MNVTQKRGFVGIFLLYLLRRLVVSHRMRELGCRERIRSGEVIDGGNVRASFV